MFCPFCGAKNSVELGGTCFVCDKRLPAFDEAGKSRASAAGGRSSTAPAQSAGGEPIAALGDRLIAVILDTVFVATLLSVGFVWGASRWRDVEGMFSSRAMLSSSLAGAIALFYFLYYWLLEGAFGATLGKAVAGIHVRPIDGAGRIGFKSALWRNLLRLVDGIGFYFLGYLVAIFTRQRRRLGDFAAGTIVVQRNMAWGERVTVVLLWLVGVAGFSWGAYAVCPRCVDLNVAALMEQIGIDRPSGSSASVPHLASN